MTTTSDEVLLSLALELTASLSSADRNQRLIGLVRRALPCDAVALLRLEGEVLLPVVYHGFTADMGGRRFLRSEHPRLDIICARSTPTRFPADDRLPDPYDGLVTAGAEHGPADIHSCLGCPLLVEDELVGVLTADALEPGAFDAISDGFLMHLSALSAAALRTNALIEALQDHAERQGQRVKTLARESAARHRSPLLGRSPGIERLRRDAELFARSRFPVLVTGETGVGKELVVRLLHDQSPRAEEPLVYVNCAALPESVVESELFGHKRGAFTGAIADRVGKFRLADGASLFLDEIGELPLSIQPKLLRALQDGEIQTVGEDRPIRVDVRIFAATNRDLEAEAAAGRFRPDLLHRLNVCRIHVPPLRERKDDLPLLAGYFADRGRAQLGTGPIRFSPEAQGSLQTNDWLGNVRELENAIYRASLRASRRSAPGEAVLIEADDFAIAPAEPSAPAEPEPGPVLGFREHIEATKRRLITEAVARNDGNWAAAARELGLGRANLHHLARRLGLK